MRIERGFWLSLTNRHESRILYQCATDTLTDEEFLTLWNQAGKIVIRTLSESKAPDMSFEVRAQKLT